MEGGRFWHQEDPRRRIILASYVFCIQFTCKGLHSFLALVSGTKKILVPYKLPSLGRS